MKIGNTGRHYDALKKAGPEINKLISQEFNLKEVIEFRRSWNGPEFDIYAFVPLIDHIEVQMHNLAEKYRINGPKPCGFIMEDGDAHLASQCLETLLFLFSNSLNRPAAALVLELSEIKTHYFALAANIQVALAACGLGTKYHNEPNIPRKENVDKIVSLIENRGLVTLKSMGVSEYLEFITGYNGPEPLQVNQFRVPAEQVATSSVLDLIRQGMEILDTDLWFKLICECHKHKADSIEKRIELVKLDVSLAMIGIKLDSPRLLWETEASRYINLVDPQILDQFSELCSLLCMIISFPTHSRQRVFITEAILTKLQDTDLLLFAITNYNTPLLNTILRAYQDASRINSASATTTRRILSPACSELALETLVSLNYEDKKHDIQLALLKIMKLSIELKNPHLSIETVSTQVVEKFFSMIRAELARENTHHIAEGLLYTVSRLITADSAITIASDTNTFRTLADSCRVACLQPSAIKAFVTILRCDILYYTYVGDLWPGFVAVSDSLAFVTLYDALCESERGLLIVEQYTLRDRLVDVVFGYALENKFYSAEYYITAGNAIVSDEKALSLIGNQLYTYLRGILSEIDRGVDESQFDTRGAIFKRFSTSERIVNHTLSLLATIAHKETIRQVLRHETGLDLIFQLISNQKLPYDYNIYADPSESLNVLLSEVMIGGAAQTTSAYFIKRMSLGIENGNLKQVSAAACCFPELPLQNLGDSTAQVVDSICNSAQFKNICSNAFKLLGQLLYKEAEYFSGPDSSIIHCFWQGPREMPENSFGASAGRWQTQQLLSFQKLGISYKDYDKVHGEAAFIRRTRVNLGIFLRYLLDFLQNVEMSKICGPRLEASVLYYEGMVSALKKIDVCDIKGRYTLVAFLQCTTLSSNLFVASGGMEAIINLYCKLQKVKGDSDKIKVSVHAESNYVQECLVCIDGCFEDFMDFKCQDDSHFSPQVTKCSAKALEKYYQGVGHMMKAVIHDSTIAIPVRFRNIRIDRSHYLEPCSALGTLCAENYQSILHGQTGFNILYTAKLLLEVIKGFEQYNHTLDDLISLLSSRYDHASLALSCALLDQGFPINLSIPEIVAVLESGDSSAVLCAAQLLRKHTPPGPCDVSTLVSIIKSHRDPETLFILCGLISRSVAWGSSVTPSQVFEVADHCIHCLEGSRYSKESVQAFCMLNGVFVSLLVTDPGVFESIVLSRIDSLDEILAKDPIKVENELPKYMDSDTARTIVEKNCLYDPDSNTVYWKDYIVESQGGSRMARDAIQGDMVTLCDQVMERYIENVKIVTETGTRLYDAYNAFSELRGNVWTLNQVCWGDKASESVVNYTNELWNAFRSEYYRLRLYSNTIDFATRRTSPAIDHYFASPKFNEFIYETLKCAKMLAMHSKDEQETYWEKGQVPPPVKWLALRPVMNLLESPDYATVETLVKSIETALENPRLDPHEIACGLLFILQIDSTTCCNYMPQLNNSRVLDICQNLLNFRRAAEEDSTLEWLWLRFTQKELLERQDNEPDESQEAQDMIDPVDATSQALVRPSQEDLLEGRESFEGGSDCDMASPGQESDQDTHDTGEDHSMVNMDQYSDEGSQYMESGGEIEDVENYEVPDQEDRNLESNHPNSRDESGDDSYQSSYEEEVYFQADSLLFYNVSDVFGESSYTSFFPRYEGASYPIFDFDMEPQQDAVQKTLTEIPDRDEDDFYDDIAMLETSETIWEVGLDLKLEYKVDDPAYKHTVLFPWGTRSVVRWPCHLSYPYSSGQSLWASITTGWRIFQQELPKIDWSKVGRLDQPKTSKLVVKPRAHGHAGVNDAIILESLGIEREYIEAIPEELRLETITSWLTNGDGREMNLVDILASLDEESFYDIFFENPETGKYQVPDYIVESNAAQLITAKPPTKALKRNHMKRFPPSKLQWSLNTHVYFSYFTRQSVQYMSCTSSKEDDIELLDYFIANLEKYHPEAVYGTLVHLYDAGKNHIAVDLVKLLKVIDSKGIIGVAENLKMLCHCITNYISVHGNPQNRLIEPEIVSLVFDALFRVSLCPLFDDVKGNTRDLLSLLLNHGYMTTDSVCLNAVQDIVEKLQEHNREANSYTIANIDTTLKVLLLNDFYGIDRSKFAVPADILEEFSKGVSDTIQKGATGHAYIKAIRCYLILENIVSGTTDQYIEFVKANRALFNTILDAEPELLRLCAKNLGGHYDLLDFELKTRMLPKLTNKDRIELIIDRESVIDSTVSQAIQHTLRDGVKIVFKGEIGYDEGGLRREWLTLFGRELMEGPGFRINKVEINGELVLHPFSIGDKDVEWDTHTVIGQIIAISIILNEPIGCGFTDFVYKALLDSPFEEPSLDLNGLKTFNPDLARSLEWILENDITGVIMETFTGDVEWKRVELKPGGSKIIVDETNKQEYVDLRLSQILQYLRKPLRLMRTGLTTMIDWDIIQIFSPNDIHQLLTGISEINVAEWKENTIYNIYNANSGPVCFFWQVIDAMTPKERGQMLMFVTGSDRVSPHGFSMQLKGNGTKFTIAKQFTGMLSTVSSCSFTLNLPPYTSYDECRIHLKKALDLGGVGFGLS